MSVLKKMTGTDTFLELPDSAKNCKTETFEECHAVRYVAEVQKQCGSLPWGLNSTLTQQVNDMLANRLLIFYLQEVSFCPPSSAPCYSAVSTTDTYGCKVSCTGLYADVEFTEDQVLVDTFDSMKEELAQLIVRGKYLSNLFMHHLTGGKAVHFSRSREGEDREAVLKLVEQYKQYKTDFAQNIVFDSSCAGLSKI